MRQLTSVVAGQAETVGLRLISRLFGTVSRSTRRAVGTRATARSSRRRLSRRWEAEAEGAREAEQTRAETLTKTAAIARKTAELDAQASVTLGRARAGAKQLEAEAKSELFTLAVSAFGSGGSLQPMDIRHWSSG